VSAFLCVVLSCVCRGLGAGLFLRPRSPTKCLNGSISKKKSDALKGKRKNDKEEEDTAFPYAIFSKYYCRT